MSSLLRMKGVNAYYDAYHALHDASLSISTGERVALFGHNGSGKSTLMKCFIGAMDSVEGSVMFNDKVIKPGNVPDNVKIGIAYVPQSQNVFKNLSVERNLLISGLMRSKTKFDIVWTLFPNLYERRRQIAGLMSGGEQQMLAFSMALMTEPKLLLLDEPTSGLSPRMSETLLKAMVDVSSSHGISLVVIEHNVPRTLAYVDRAIILKSGAILKDAPAKELAQQDNLWAWF